MARPLSKINHDWWDYTTLDPQILADAARLTVRDIEQLARPGFEIRMYDTMESFWMAEALEYINVWRRATESEPAGICGPIGPTEQLPLVAQLVNDLELDVRNGHFWGMDEWYNTETKREEPPSHPLSFARADMEMCFDRIDPRFRMPDENIHFPTIDGLADYSASYDSAKCLLMQGGQGEVKHWAFNDPVRREGKWKDSPPTPAEYRTLGARVVELHPLTLIQNARTSFAGQVSSIPTHALTVGPVETWKSETVSIWHPGVHDNAFGIRLSAFMISKKLPDSSVPMSLLADHPHVRFNYYRPGIGSTGSEMH
jgi:glucosamine-6-phosphate deaminase